MSDRVRPEPAKYKTTNWRRYNQALNARGALMIWLDRDLQWSGLAKLAGLSWQVPDYSTVCRRQKTLKVRIPYRPSARGLHLLVDSTGLKMMGGGEW